MIRSQQVRIRRRIIAGICAAVAQLFIATAPLAEARSGPDARAHVEVAGTSLHHAHDEATCAACISQHLLATAEPARAHAAFVRTASLPPHVSGADTQLHALQFLNRSRAPPATSV
jgi:hypothetical protein